MWCDCRTICLWTSGMLGFLKRLFGRAQSANYGLDAARYDEAWPWSTWPLRPNDDIDAADRRTIWQRAREMYHNSPQIRKAVKSMIQFTGGLTPLPMTTDVEWNELALAAFLARTKNPRSFDVAARVNYKQALRWMERCAIVDGDCAVVPTRGADGGALFAFYAAPQIAGGGDNGVELDERGRAVAYWFSAGVGEAPVRVEAARVMLYQHDPDPARARGVSELVAALRTARDVHAIVGYAKNGQRMANSMGLVGTKAVGAKVPDIARGIGPGAKRNGSCDGVGPRTELGTGLQITYLPEGCDIRAIQDGRPSTQLQEFFKFLVRCIAQGVGLDPEVLFYSNEMGSAAVRFSLAKVSKWQEERLTDLEPVCNRIWQHVISCEVAAGRLRPCADRAWMNVRWVPGRDMTIDTPRVAQAHINLVREGMADNTDFTLRTTGLTPQQLDVQRAAELAAARATAERFGLRLSDLRPGSVGAAGGVGQEDEQREAVPVVPDPDPEAV